MMTDKAIFYFTPRHSNDFREITDGLRRQEDFRKFILDHLDENLMVTIERRRDSSERSKLSTFFNGVIVPNYVRILFENGENVNKVEARDRLKSMFLKDIKEIDGKEMVYTKSQKDLSTPELLFFVNQVLMHIAEDYNSAIPDQDTYMEAQAEEDSIYFKLK